MDNLKLGYVIDRPQEKDAIHVAVAPAVAGEKLKAGDRLKFFNKEKRTVLKTDKAYEPYIGIVDPFLNPSVPLEVGQEFWMFLKPGSVTSIRHDWTHPEFPEAPITQDPRFKAAKAIEHWADKAGLSYYELIDGARCYLQYGAYLCDGGRWEGFSLPNYFWDDYQTVTGEIVPEEKRGHFFSCSC